ncbi:hypothetical protein BS17DRAFT_790901 [Gyrodon lividus]|nr:hypothetical protein BS17DRAFT_790901 [Gyrodon lividus]
MWDLVGETLEAAEKVLFLVFNDAEDVRHAKGQESDKVKQQTPEALMRLYSITAQNIRNSASSLTVKCTRSAFVQRPWTQFFYICATNPRSEEYRLPHALPHSSCAHTRYYLHLPNACGPRAFC